MNKEQIKEAVEKDSVVLFMKGTRDFPQCGFSGRVIQILEQFEVKFQEYDVLADSELRDSIKEYSDWPTIPQLYVSGEFIGGSDIVYDMWRDGELDKIFREAS
jgi:monothiol glutaredoxin